MQCYSTAENERKKCIHVRFCLFVFFMSSCSKECKLISVTISVTVLDSNHERYASFTFMSQCIFMGFLSWQSRQSWHFLIYCIFETTWWLPLTSFLFCITFGVMQVFKYISVFAYVHFSYVRYIGKIISRGNIGYNGKIAKEMLLINTSDCNRFPLLQNSTDTLSLWKECLLWWKKIVYKFFMIRKQNCPQE